MSGFEPLLLAAKGAASAGWIAPALSVVGTLVQAGAARSQGQAAQAAAEYNAQAALTEARSREAAQRAESDRRLGTIRANIGKSGATSEGTPLLVLAESAANAEIDALNTRYTGQQRADVYRAGGANARRQGNIMAGTSLLSGGARLFGG